MFALTERRDHLDPAGAALLAVLCLSWGIQQVSIKLAMIGVSPVMQAGLRSVIAVTLLYLWMRRRGVPLMGTDGLWKPGLVIGTLFSLEFWLLYWALEFTSASRAIIFLYMSPFVVAAGAHLLLPGERLNRLQIAGMVIAFGGIVVVFQGGLHGPAMAGAWIGDVMAFAAAVFWGLTTLVIRTTSLARAAPSRSLFFQLLVSACLLPLVSMLQGEPGITALTPLVIGCLFYQGVIVAFASYLVWFWMIAHYPVPQLAGFTFLAPVFGVSAGVMLLDEPLSASLVAGAALVGAGIYIVNRPG